MFTPLRAAIFFGTLPPFTIFSHAAFFAAYAMPRAAVAADAATL